MRFRLDSQYESYRTPRYRIAKLAYQCNANLTTYSRNDIFVEPRILRKPTVVSPAWVRRGDDLGLADIVSFHDGGDGLTYRVRKMPICRVAAAEERKANVLQFTQESYSPCVGTSRRRWQIASFTGAGIAERHRK